MNNENQTYICLECANDLTVSESGYACEKCDVRFEAAQTGFPIPFFTDPKKQMALAYLGFHRQVIKTERSIAQLAGSIKTSRRKKELLPLLKALRDNTDYFLKNRERLADSIDIPTLLEVSRGALSNSYGYDLSYLIRDWSKVGSSEIEHFVSALQSIQQHSEGDHALVLGAGAGRLAVELKKTHPLVTAVDNSFGQIKQFFDVKNSPFSLWDVQTTNRRKDSDFLKKLDFAMPENLAPLAEKVNFLWADACHTPLQAGSINTVYSIYFSDVVPLEKLLTEASRVLVDNGIFVHLGPLQFHFNDVSQHYSVESFCDELELNQFSILHQSEREQLADSSSDKGLLTPSRYTDALIVARLNKASVAAESV